MSKDSEMGAERKQEIAFLIVEQWMLEKGIPGGETLRREAGNQAQKIGVSIDDLMDFYRSFVPKIYARTFGYNEVSIRAGVHR